MQVWKQEHHGDQGKSISCLTQTIYSIAFNLFKVVVIIVIWVISLLSIYMLFLNLLEPILNKRAKQNYSEHINDEASISSNGSSGFSLHKIA